MAKEKKKPNLKVKTSRYFTKTCKFCKNEYPNWFVSCPKCGAAWDEDIIEKEQEQELLKKNIKIVVKITEEDFEEPIITVNLIFSADYGKSWYKMKMDSKMDYYIAEIADVPIGTIIIYYIEVFLSNGEKIIENNDGNYYYYKVGASISETQEERIPEAEAQTLQENISKEMETPKDYEEAKAAMENDDITIFGKPQTQIDPDLKVCPNCKSKIKKMWSICPICGSKV
ncbi:MAG: hypothetical protein ACTSQP_13210 [Promethearchaeota archaeon]